MLLLFWTAVKTKALQCSVSDWFVVLIFVLLNVTKDKVGVDKYMLTLFQTSLFTFIDLVIILKP